MGIWVVVLEAVAGHDRTTIELDDLDALGEALAPNYPQVTGGPSYYQAQFWVEEYTAGAALMLAERLWQSAIREVGLPTWDVVRGEAREAHAIEAGLIEWSPEVDEPEFGPELAQAAPAEDEAEEALLEEEGPEEEEIEEEAFEEEEIEEEEIEEEAFEEEEPEEPPLDEEAEEEPGVLALEIDEEPTEVPTGGFDLGDELEEERTAPLRPHLRAAAEKRAAARRAAREQGAQKRAAAEKAAPKKATAKKLRARTLGARRPPGR